MAKKPAKKSASISQILNFSEFDRVFDSFRKDLEKSFYSFPRIDIPSFPKLHETTCDVIDEGKQLLVKMNVPGVTKKDIHLNVSDSALEVSAEHKEESEEKKKNYLRKERIQVSYERILLLPEKIVPGKVKSKPTSIQKKRSIKIQ
jgi:HSP20 family protein